MSRTRIRIDILRTAPVIASMVASILILESCRRSGGGPPAANEPPVVDLRADLAQASFGRVVTLTALGSTDPDEGPDALSYLWTQAAGEPRIEPLTPFDQPELSFRAPFVDTDLHIRCDVSDGVDRTRQSLTIRVRNTEPIADAGADFAADPLGRVVLDGLSSLDPDQPTQEISYLWAPPAGVTLDDPTSSQPRFDAPPDARILPFGLTVSDGFASSLRDDLTIDVNRRPVADAGANSTVVPAATVTLDAGESFDPEGEALSYFWTFPEGIRPNDPGGESAPNPSFVAPLREGPYDVFLTVDDGHRPSLPDRVRITVDSQQRAPLARALPYQEVSINSSGVILLGTSSRAATPGSDLFDGLLFEWTLADDGASGIRFTPSPDAWMTLNDGPSSPADLLFQLEVIDPTVDTEEPSWRRGNTDLVWIRVLDDAGNRRPSAEAGDNQSVDPGVSVTLDGSASDDGDDGLDQPLTYRWFQVDGPRVSLETVDGQPALVTFTAPDPGPASLVFKLVVGDPLRASLPDEVTVSVSNDHPPVADISVEGGQQQPICSTVTLSATGSSDEEDPIDAWAWDLDTEATPGLETDDLNWNPPSRDTEVVTIDLPAFYDDPITISLSVHAGNDWSPVARAVIEPINGTPQITLVQITPNDILNPLATASLQGDATDPDSCQALVFSWRQVTDPDWPDLDVELDVAPDGRSASFIAPPFNLARERGSPTAPLVFELTVTDEAGAAMSEQVSVDLLPGFVHDILDGILERNGCSGCHNVTDAMGEFGPLTYREVARECSPTDPGFPRIHPSADRLEVENSVLLLRPSGIGHGIGPTVWQPGDLPYETIVWWILGGGLWDNGDSGVPRDNCGS